MDADGVTHMIRRHIVFTGRVQGVGFRWRALYAAQGLGLSGWVKNETDGSVTLEVQGEALAINEFLREIRGGRYVEIHGMEAKGIPVREDERGFRVYGY